MEIQVGAVLEGKVTGITKFGAFVALPGGKSGMVHISEVAPTFVKEISDFVSVNQTVKVKVISIDPNGRIALSMKQLAEPQKREERTFRPRGSRPARTEAPSGSKVPIEIDWSYSKKTEGLSFEDKLNKFKQDSDERMLALRRTIDGKRGGSGRRGGKNNY
ncbi:MAG: S1 RNA-binding domain-containing protein [Eubacteriales bacterium]|jgi:S1 RNA binding domain protein